MTEHEGRALPPLVSAIIATYNREQYLAAAISSIAVQTYSRFEIIVVDDGSTNSTAEIVRGFPSVRYIYQPNSGHAVARNRGLAEARGEFIAFLDSDDLWTPDKLEVQIDYMLEHPHIMYCIGMMRNFLEAGLPIPAGYTEDALQRDFAGYLPSTFVARQAVFDIVGLLDTGFTHGEDSEWFFKAKDLGVPMAVVPNLVLHRRLHSANESSQVDGLQHELLTIVRKSIARRNKPEQPAQEEGKSHAKRQ